MYGIKVGSTPTFHNSICEGFSIVRNRIRKGGGVDCLSEFETHPSHHFVINCFHGKQACGCSFPARHLSFWAARQRLWRAAFRKAGKLHKFCVKNLCNLLKGFFPKISLSINEGLHNYTFFLYNYTFMNSPNKRTLNAKTIKFIIDKCTIIVYNNKCQEGKTSQDRKRF